MQPDLRIQVFAGLADLMGGAFVTVPAPSKAITAADLKQLLQELYPQAAGLLEHSFVAVNQQYAAPEQQVTSKDEIAVIPPVSGGQPQEPAPCTDAETDSAYRLTTAPIQTEEVLRHVLHANHGASLVFVGTTREWTHGKRTLRLDYEAYEPMAIGTMRQIGEEIGTKWPKTKVAITHRLGTVAVGEASVVIAVSAPHRDACYEASRYAIERLKQIVPIWKKEIWEDGYEWKGHQLGPWNPTQS